MLAKHPILVVALGLVGAVHFLTGNPNPTSPPALLPEEIVEQRAQGVKGDRELQEQTKEASVASEAVVAQKSGVYITSAYLAALGDSTRYFEAILNARRARDSRGVHPDGKSYGPSGLTPIAVRELLRKIPDCTSLSVKKVLLTPEENLKLGYLYFLDLVHRFRNVETAVVAYHIGPTKVSLLLRKGKPIPRRYLDTVKKFPKQ
ncbi:MAG: hypothetical protein HY221_02225 [Candidatus Sungbacteria bacterium]|uniref:Transglycosylase SLT domain-containing protein n=1 Tax=Candidatus Sungiibacteriota bacterium TaxID=2750080 RepID=A0A932QYE4_9BACT|nr:hypothetical protein [Candidatus Sungbacteria bacterium]